MGGRGHLQGKLLTQVICVQRTAAAWKGTGRGGEGRREEKGEKKGGLRRRRRRNEQRKREEGQMRKRIDGKRKGDEKM